jgi:hypothetical protein
LDGGPSLSAATDILSPVQAGPFLLRQPANGSMDQWKDAKPVESFPQCNNRLRKAREQLLAFQAGQITLATIKGLAVIDSLQ